MGFQTKVNQFPAPAVEGDFASNNPRSVVLAGPGGLVCGAKGVTVGRFAWVSPDDVTVNNFGAAPAVPDGFVHRDQQGLITAYLQEDSMLVPEGFPITLHRTGDFWAKNNGPAALAKGAAVYASYEDGSIWSAAPAGASFTASLGSTNTASLGSTSTGTAVVGNPYQITLSAVTGLVSVGDSLAGVGITAGTQIVSQISGTPGGAGVYELNDQNTAAAATITSFGDIIDVTVSAGLISIGDTVSGGAGFPVGATIVSQVSGTAGGVGVYKLSAAGTAYVASAAGVTTFGNVLNVTAVASGVLAPGMPITGANMPATSIASQVSGAIGGVGVYTLFAPGTQYVAAEAVTTVGGIQTGWVAEPTSPGDGAVGALVKISK